MSLDKNMIRDRYRIIPNRQTVMLYRMNAMDEVIDTRKVDEVEVRNVSRRDDPGQTNPSPSKNRVFHMWVDLLDGWEVEEFDYIKYGCDWYLVNESSLEMMDTRYRATCVKSSSPVD